MRTAVTLINSSFIGSSAGNAFYFEGGRSVVVVAATQYGGGVFLQTQAANQKWLAVNGTTYSADQVTAYDLPEGQYRMISNVGSTIGIAATLVPIPYGG